MPVYKDKERDTWFCKFNYKDWRDETKTKLKRGFRTKRKHRNGKENSFRYSRLTWTWSFLSL